MAFEQRRKLKQLDESQLEDSESLDNSNMKLMAVRNNPVSDLPQNISQSNEGVDPDDDVSLDQLSAEKHGIH